MKRNVLGMLAVGVATLTLCGCPTHPEFNDLKFSNNGDVSVRVYINVRYPDSSFQEVAGAGRVEPHRSTYLLRTYDLTQYDGLTLFIFDDAYVESRWFDGAGRPHTYLEEERVLEKYYLSKSELDSLDWVVVYP